MAIGSSDHHQTTRFRSRRNSVDDIYQELKEQILRFQIPPGARLTETQTAQKFGVSRTPIRQALQHLETDGLLVIRPKQGCFVRDIDLESMRHYFHLREYLEQMAVRTACQNMTDHALQSLAQQWQPNTLALHNTDNLLEQDERFHLQLARGGGNQVLPRYLRELNGHIRLIRYALIQQDPHPDDLAEEHFNIVQALLERDEDMACRRMSRHIHLRTSALDKIDLSGLTPVKPTQHDQLN
ncbi:HTH-type transcriptional repressor RspR [Sinobacterium norvegicum]|uniref:HTH-type transcriptional repressor RspR n=1 Tax=Sinobacterium norvegicum TaxID=1641715 RepID=A0ABM9AE61_9GAMM|nr:GntR family transcriptional regulator [Sinobacterium norvegicum]CAH0991502.1 HTH-type transcriptional repressor RspR [Sinobacterium norvegicum]